MSQRLGKLQNQLPSTSLRVFPQRSKRWRVFASRKRPLQARHRRRLRTHAFSHLRLRQACVMPGFQQEVEQLAFFAFNAFNFFANAGRRISLATSCS